MYINSLGRRYNLVEFNLYGTGAVDGGETYVLEMLIECTLDEFEKAESSFAIQILGSCYVLDDFRIDEYYEEGDGVKVVYVK